MSEHKENVPKLRFPGFTGAWEERKLYDLMFFSNGINAPKQSYGKGRKMISVMDILSKEPLTYNKIRGSVTVDDKIEQKNKVEKGDLVFVRSSEIREEVGWAKAYLQEEYALYSGFSIRGKKNSSYDVYFIELSLNYINRNQIERKAGGSTRYNVSQGILNNIIIFEPTLDEQVKISGFFKALDNDITLHQRKLNNVKNLKAGLLQKMFPKDGEDVPEVRFPGFTEAWEQRSLGEYAKYRRGSFPQPYGNKEWYDGEGAMPFVQVVDVTDHLVLVDDTKQKISKLAQHKSVFVPKGKVVVTLQGSIGRVALTQYDAFVDRTLLIFEDYEKPTDEYFWAYIIQQKFEIEKRKAPGGTIKTITKEALSSFEVPLPAYEEQKKIGVFFSTLDHLITLHQRKLEHLQEQKKALLQQMFI